MYFLIPLRLGFVQVEKMAKKQKTRRLQEME
jgi:hypothetical protein